ncbi:porin [Pseudovibrio exalbescens]|uniref:porin n=1 Tax=Pseudovibrio exalbescens TaxID=197461 RepID=UPI0023657A7D|nr:porin [Pseudovibrio exalbescens]MDD7908352.1 porin [Pseudovibrio exalbescens]
MKLKAILLATAGFAVAGSASAADLPVVAEPVDYVQVCDAYGAGFFKIPGKDTCIKIGGRIRTQIISDNLDDNNDETKYEDYEALARGYLYLTSMTDTEIGLIKTFTELYSQWDENGGERARVGDAYIQIGTDFANVFIGRDASQFDGFTGAVDIGVIDRNFSDQSTLQFALTKSLGNGVSATVAVEDSSYRNGSDNSIDFVGKVGISQGWGSFEVAGATHAIADEASFNDSDGDAVATLRKDDSTGYAVRGTVTFNLDMIAPGDAFVFQAAYADSAASYLNASLSDEAFDRAGAIRSADAAMLDVLGAKGYSLVAAFSHYWTPEIATTIDGSWMSLEADYNNNGFDFDADMDRWAIDASIGWYPVSGMVVALDAGFASTDYDVEGEDRDFDEAKIGARVQYTF